MKVLFLDVDGVLNSRNTTNFDELYPIDPYMAFLVGRIQLQTGCEVILSSSWRYHPEGRQNVSKRVVELFDVTPTVGECRGEEIQAWLDLHPEVTKYAILDDDCDMLVGQADSFFKTTFEDGLTDEIAEAVIKHLGVESGKA